MKVENIVAHTRQELILALSSLRKMDSPTTLIQLFASLPSETFASYARIVRDLFPKATLIGATSDGEIANANIHTRSCMVSLIRFEASEISASFAKEGDPYEIGEEFGGAMPRDTVLFLTFSAGLSFNSEAYLRGLQKELPKGVHVAGGVAGDLGRFERPVVLLQDRFFENGAVGVAIRSKELEVIPFYKFGWKGIGLSHIVTESEGNRVYTIDDRSVVEFYQHYLGLDLAHEFPQTAVEFPLMLQLEQGEVARAAVKLYEDGSVGFAGDVPRGSRVKIGVADITSVINDNTQGVCFDRPPELFLLYACMARRRFLGRVARMELQPFAKNAPTIGFYTYGEFYTQQGVPKLFNETLTGVGLREKWIERECVPYAPLKTDRMFVKNLHAMWHVVETTAKEYQELIERIEGEKEKIEQLKNLLSDKFLKLFESMKEGVVIVDEKFDVVEYNRAFYELAAKEVRNLVEIFDPECVERLLGSFSNTFETRLKNAKDVLVTYTRLEEGRYSYYLVILTDLTPIKNKERQALEQSKLAQMGEMINMIAHQWRQPLNALSAAAIKLEMKSEIGAARREDIEEFTRFVQKTVQNMSSTIETFLNFSKKRSVLESFEIGEVIDDAIFMIGAQLRARGIVLEKRRMDRLFLKAYRSDLLQIVLNLLSNARDVLSRNAKEEKRIWIDVIVEEAEAVIRIEDSGGGVEEAIVSRIFEPYFTTKGPQGTGLGLYMSKRLAKEKLGGDLIYKKGAQGAIFELRIPVGGG